MSDERIKLCGALLPQHVFSHYAYGDPLPIYARFISDAEEATRADDAITIYVACQREAGHSGKHLASANRGWSPELLPREDAETP